MSLSACERLSYRSNEKGILLLPVIGNTYKTGGRESCAQPRIVEKAQFKLDDIER